MANKNFSRLTTRNQSTLISQLFKLISYYSSTFCTRERVYLKKLSQKDGNIYWLEDDTKKLTAAAIIDRNYEFKAGNISLISLGHTISKRQGQMERLLQHIFSDHENTSLALICKSFVAESINVVEDFGLVEFSPLSLQKFWPELAEVKTDYFNVKNETLAAGMARKEHNLYVKFSKADLAKLKDNFVEIWNIASKV